jgi:hypothetical protein
MGMCIPLIEASCAEAALSKAPTTEQMTIDHKADLAMETSFSQTGENSLMSKTCAG